MRVSAEPAFVVMANNGQPYEDSHDWPLAVVDYEEDGLKLIEELEAWRDECTAALPPCREWDLFMPEDEKDAWEQEADARAEARDLIERRFGLCPDKEDPWYGTWSLSVKQVPKVLPDDA